jgi:glycosyltransferase involved in cell wall biosynthesis
MTPPPLRLAVELAGSITSDGWPDRYWAGEVADRSPYGFHRLADYGVEPWIRGTVAGGIRGRLDGFVLHRTGLALAQTVLPRSRAPWRPDVVLAWNERQGIPAVARETVSRRRIPVVSGTIWATEPSGQRLMAVRGWLARCAAVFVLSTAQLAPLREIASSARVRYLPFGVDTGYFTATGPTLTSVMPLPTEVNLLLDQHPVVLSVGNDRDRDHATLRRAMALLAAPQRPNTESPRLLLASRAAAAIPAELGLQLSNFSASQLLGSLRRARIFAVATRPNLHVSGMTALLEAMSVGLPIVASRTPGISDYVQHGETGLLVDCGDEQTFARAIRDLLADPDRAAAMGNAAARRVRERNDVGLMQQRIADLVRQI